jgi:hypothetical protein
MRQNYYLVRIYDEDNQPLSTRCEKAIDCREACKKAFGVVYDHHHDTARWCCIGAKMLRNLTGEEWKRLTVPENWHLFHSSNETSEVERKKTKMKEHESTYHCSDREDDITGSPI